MCERQCNPAPGNADLIWVNMARDSGASIPCWMNPCFHCGLPCAGRRSVLLGELRDFCCAGCEAVAHTIVDGGFESYYRTRTEPASTPHPRPTLENLPNNGSASLILEGLRC